MATAGPVVARDGDCGWRGCRPGFQRAAIRPPGRLGPEFPEATPPPGEGGTYTTVHYSVRICKGKNRASEGNPSACATAWRKPSSANEFWRALILTKQWHTEAVPPAAREKSGVGAPTCRTA
jgi:hypothetical protein